MDPNDDIVLGGVGVGDVRQGQSTDAGIAVSNCDGLHDSFLPWGILSSDSQDDLAPGITAIIETGGVLGYTWHVLAVKREHRDCTLRQHR
jgi:hypothetical protein